MAARRERRPRPSSLTARQQRFVEEYLVDLNATQAAIRAGYSTHTARQIASENLSRPDMQRQIADRHAAVLTQLGVTLEQVISELRRVGFSDMREFVDWGPKGVILRDGAVLPGDSARCVAEVTQTESKGGRTVRLKLHDKVRTLALLGRHLGLGEDRQEDHGVAMNLYADGKPLSHWPQPRTAEPQGGQGLA